MISFSESAAAEKTILLIFSFVYFFCVGGLILKIILSHAHKWVTSDVIL